MKFSSWVLLLSGLAIVGVVIYGYFTSSFPPPFPARDRAAQSERAQAPAKEQGDRAPQVGQPFAFGGLRYSISETRRADSAGQGAAAVNATASFVLVQTRIENQGKEPVILHPGDFVLYDGQGRRFSVHVAATSAASAPGARDPFSEAIQPGLSREITLAFDAPAQASGLKLRIYNGYVEADLGQ